MYVHSIVIAYGAAWKDTTGMCGRHTSDYLIPRLGESGNEASDYHGGTCTCTLYSEHTIFDTIHYHHLLHL